MSWMVTEEEVLDEIWLTDPPATVARLMDICPDAADWAEAMGSDFQKAFEECPNHTWLTVFVSRLATLIDDRGIATQFIRATVESEGYSWDELNDPKIAPWLIRRTPRRSLTAEQKLALLRSSVDVVQLLRECGMEP